MVLAKLPEAAVKLRLMAVEVVEEFPAEVTALRPRLLSRPCSRHSSGRTWIPPRFQSRMMGISLYAILLLLRNRDGVEPYGPPSPGSKEI